MRSALVLGLPLVLVLLPLAPPPDPGELPNPEIAAAMRPYLADVDADGDLDVVTAEGVWFHDGKGAYTLRSPGHPDRTVVVEAGTARSAEDLARHFDRSPSAASEGIAEANAATDLYARYLCLDHVDDYARVNDNATLDLGTGPEDDFTIETFFYVPDLTNTTIDGLIWKDRNFGLWVGYNTTSPDRFVFKFWRDLLQPSEYIYADLDLTVGWHHVAAVWNNAPGTGSDYLSIYADGNLLLTSTGLQTTAGFANSPDPLFLGASWPLYYAAGHIEETRLSDVIRYSGSTYVVPTMPFSGDGNGRALYHFDGNLEDSSGNGNHLTAMGAAGTCAGPGVAVSPLVLTVEEVGTSQQFSVRLDAAPTGNVVIDLVSADTSEATISPSQLTFTPADWASWQSVWVTGVNDARDDGDQVTAIELTMNAGSASEYLSVDPPDVSVTTTDDDTAQIYIPAALTIHEFGITEIWVGLASEPDGDVVIGVTSDDPGEVTVSPSTWTFTASNYGSGQLFNLTGVDDWIDDGDQTTTITVAINIDSSTEDGPYEQLPPAGFVVTTVDDEVAEIGVFNVPESGLSVSESGTTVSFSVGTRTEPVGDVVIDVIPADPTEVSVDPSRVTITPSNWRDAHWIWVTGVDDRHDDGDQVTTIVLTVNAADSADPVYEALDPAEVTVTTEDDDLGIVATSPAANATAAPRGTDIAATAGAAVNPATVTAATLRAAGHLTGRIAGAYSVADATFALNPTSDLKPGETVRVTSTGGIATMGAVSLASNVWQLTAAAGAATGVMVAHPTTPSFNGGPYSDGAVLGDLDADGDVDAVVTNTGDPQQVWLNDGAGNLTRHPTAPTFSSPARRVVLGDVDMDGDLDALVSVWSLPGAALVFRNGGAGAFSYRGVFGSDNSASAALGDLDGDGDLDAVTAHQGAGLNEKAWLNDGTGSFSAHPTTPAFGTTGLTSDDVALGDLDGDGDLDAVAANNDAAETVWLNDGAGNFTAHPGTPAFGGSEDTHRLVLADLDGDGDLDAVAAHIDGSCTNWRNDGSGNFSAHPTVPSFASWPNYALVTGDVEGDGDLDVLVSAPGGVRIFLNDGAGALSAHPNMAVFGSGETWDAALADLDGDGDLDAVVARVSGTETVWLNANPGIKVAPTSGLSTTEGGGTATFTVVLTAPPAPATSVSTTLTSSDTTEGRVSTDGATQANAVTLTFTSANWSTPQTVTLHGQDDFLADGDMAWSVTTSATTSADARFHGLEVADVSATNGDDDGVGVIVSEAAVTVGESGTVAEFTVSLASEPNGAVAIDVASSDMGEATVNYSSLMFTSTNWNVAVPVTVTGVDDSILDGERTSTIVLTTNAASTTDPLYDVIDPVDVTVTTIDDETAGFAISKSAVTVTEAGGTESFTVALAVQPVGNVVVDVASLDTSEATVDVSELTFTTSDWASARTVTVTGIDDAFGDGDVATTIALTVDAASSHDLWDGADPPDVVATTTDDDRVAITATIPAANEKSAPRSATIQATASEAIDATTVTASTFRAYGDLTGVLSGARSGNGASFQLDPAADFKPGETIYVTAAESGILNALRTVALIPRVWQFTAAAGAAGGLFIAHPTTPSFGAGASTGVALGDLDGDGDLDAVVADPYTETGTTVWVNDGSGSYAPHPTTPTLAELPAGDVALGDLDGDGDLDAIFATLSGHDAVWMNNGTGSLSPLETAIDAGSGFSVALGDIDADGDLDAVITTGPGADTVWVNDGTGSFAAHAETPTLGVGYGLDVVLGDIDGDGDLDAVVTTAGTLDHQDERVWTNDGRGNFVWTSSFGAAGESGTAAALGDIDGDGDLDAVVAGLWSETAWLNDGSGGFTLHPTTPEIMLHDGSFGVGLGDIDGDGDLDAVFPSETSNSSQSVYLNDGSGAFSPHPVVPSFGAVAGFDVALGDIDGDGDLDAVIANDNAAAETVWINRLNPGITVAPTSGLVTTEAGGEAAFTVVLDTVPVDDVVVTVETLDSSEGIVATDGAMPEPSVTLTFTPSNWSSAQTVTLYGRADFLVDGDMAWSVALDVSSSDPLYDGFALSDVTATNLDVDKIVVVPTELTVAEGGTATFTVALASQPSGNVVFMLFSPEDDVMHGEPTVSPAEMTFTPSNWATPQTATVTGGDDLWIDGDALYEVFVAADPARTDDSAYHMAYSMVSVTTTDADTAVLLVDQTQLTVMEGEAAPFARVYVGPNGPFAVVADVNLDEAQLIADPARLTFLGPENWTPQLVRIGAVNDDVDEDDMNLDVILSVDTAATEEFPYGVPPNLTIQVTIVDDDTAGIGVSLAALSVGEGGTSSTFTVVLQSQPAGTVVINVAAADPGEATASPTQLAFDAANWSAPQTVTVTGVDDALDDGDQATNVGLTVNQGSGDPKYKVLDPPDVTVTTTDDDPRPTTTALASSPNPSVAGQSVTFTATVTSTTPGAVAGTVTFRDGVATLGSNALSGGVATFTTSALGAGTHAITASYGGNASYDPSASAPLAHVVNATAFGAPPFFTAAATSISRVAMSWGMVAGATSYEIHRATSIGSGYALVGTTGVTTWADTTGLAANTTYLYKVRALSATGASPFSTVDAATTIVFTDAVLGPGIQAKAIHFTELRTAVNGMRAAASLGPAIYTNAIGGTIKRVDLLELRAALTEARNAISLPPIVFTDPTITAAVTTVKAAHVSEIRGGTQ